MNEWLNERMNEWINELMNKQIKMKTKLHNKKWWFLNDDPPLPKKGYLRVEKVILIKT